MSYCNLENITEKAYNYFTALNSARDLVLKTQRDVIRCASLSIRAIHRGELESATEILQDAKEHFAKIAEILNEYKELYYSGYLLDSQKEYSEAHIT